jgi:UDP-galactopyranose mutase
VNVAREEPNVTFVGRLGTYRYLDMDVTINEALATADKFLECAKNNARMPAFAIDPLA